MPERSSSEAEVRVLYSCVHYTVCVKGMVDVGTDTLDPFDVVEESKHPGWVMSMLGSVTVIAVSIIAMATNGFQDGIFWS